MIVLLVLLIARHLPEREFVAQLQRSLPLRVIVSCQVEFRRDPLRLTEQQLHAVVRRVAENVCACLMGAGFSPNMIEVGGKQTATLNAVGNTVRASARVEKHLFALRRLLFSCTPASSSIIIPSRAAVPAHAVQRRSVVARADWTRGCS